MILYFAFSSMADDSAEAVAAAAVEDTEVDDGRKLCGDASDRSGSGSHLVRAKRILLSEK
jgi:hypothetical protein